MPDHSITELLYQLQAGESDAGREIWQLYINRLISLAHTRLKSIPRRAVDEEDVAITAFYAFLRGVAAGRFKELNSRDDLWQILAMLIDRRAIAFLRYELAEKRGEGKNRGESVLEQVDGDEPARAGLDQLEDPSPVVVEQFTLGVRMMLDGLQNESLRKIAVSKLEGYSNEEIAGHLGLSLRSVERKLQIIREKWESEQ